MTQPVSPPPVPTPKFFDPQRHAQDRAWLLEAADPLEEAGRGDLAEKFRRCHQDGVFAAFLVCRENPVEHCWPIPYGCRLPICPICSRYVASKRVRDYANPLLAAVRSQRPGYSLKHITLTTPYTLDRPDFSALFKTCRQGVDQTFTAVFRSVLGDALSAHDRQKGRVTLKDYRLGYLAAAQWGEAGGNLHFHTLVYGPLLPVAELADQWSRLTGGQHSVDLKSVKPSNDDICSVIAYISRLSAYPPTMAPRLAAFLEGKHRLWNKGIFYAHHLAARHAAHTCPECHAELIRTGFWPKNHAAHAQGEA